MNKIFDNYKKGFGDSYQYRDIESIMRDFASQVCDAIDDELYDLKCIVDDNHHSTYEILDKIDEIRKKIC